MRSFRDADQAVTSTRRAFALMPSDAVAQLSLAANTAARVAIPAGAAFVVPSFGSDVWTLFGDSTVAATIGLAGTVGTNAEYAPGAKEIPAGATHLSLIAETACKGSVSFYG